MSKTSQKELIENTSTAISVKLDISGKWKSESESQSVMSNSLWPHGL